MAKEETKKCPKCKEEIAGDAKKCKHCGADLRNWFVRHKVLTVILALFVIGIIGAAAGGGDTTTTGDGGTKKEENTKTEYKVGEKIDLGNHEIVVNKVVKGYKSTNMFDTTQSKANEFVVVNVTITNTSDDELPANEFGFTLEDEAGVKRNTTIVSDLDNTLEWVNLSKGGKLTGNMVFEAKKSSDKLVLHYTGGLWGKEITVKL